MRFSATDRCISINRKTINLHTGVEWSFFAERNDRHSTCKFMSESIPFSNTQIALIEGDDKAAFVIKNEPGSRKMTTFAHRQSDVLLF